MSNAPIGVFDSGLGGLTAVKELRALLPGEDIVYFGDTGRVPYGSRGRDIIISYAKQDIAFLLSQGVKTILAACGTVSSTLSEGELPQLPVGFSGVVPATAAAAAKATRNKKIGIIGTEVTIASGLYEKALQQIDPAIQCYANACPLFVPLVENGHFAKGNPYASLAVEEYLADIRAAGVDTLILGCTHYPLLADAIGAYMGPDVALIDSGRQAALALRESLHKNELLHKGDRQGTIRYYVTDDASKFDRYARLFLGGEAGGSVERITIEQYRL